MFLFVLGLSCFAAAVSHEGQSHHRHHHKKHSALVSHHVDLESLEEEADVNERTRTRMLDGDARWKLFAYQMWKSLAGGPRTWRTFESAWTQDDLKTLKPGSANVLALSETLQLTTSGPVPVTLSSSLLNDLVNVYLVTPSAARRFDEFVIAIRQHQAAVPKDVGSATSPSVTTEDSFAPSSPTTMPLAEGDEDAQAEPDTEVETLVEEGQTNAENPTSIEQVAEPAATTAATKSADEEPPTDEPASEPQAPPADRETPDPDTDRDPEAVQTEGDKALADDEADDEADDAGESTKAEKTDASGQSNQQTADKGANEAGVDAEEEQEEEVK